MDTLSHLVETWRANGLALPAEPSQRVVETFNHVGASATRDIVDLYGAVGGMSDMAGSNDFFLRLWSLDEIAANNPSSAKPGVIFADYLVECWLFRAHATGPDTSEIYLDAHGSFTPELIAESLSDFLRLYSTNPTEIFRPLRERGRSA